MVKSTEPSLMPSMTESNQVVAAHGELAHQTVLPWPSLPMNPCVNSEDSQPTILSFSAAHLASILAMASASLVEVASGSVVKVVPILLVVPLDSLAAHRGCGPPVRSGRAGSSTWTILPSFLPVCFSMYLRYLVTSHVSGGDEVLSHVGNAGLLFDTRGSRVEHTTKMPSS